MPRAVARRRCHHPGGQSGQLLRSRAGDHAGEGGGWRGGEGGGEGGTEGSEGRRNSVCEEIGGEEGMEELQDGGEVR